MTIRLVARYIFCVMAIVGSLSVYDIKSMNTKSENFGDECATVKKALDILVLSGALDRRLYAKLYPQIGKSLRPSEQVVKSSGSLVNAYEKIWQKVCPILRPLPKDKDAFLSVRLLVQEVLAVYVKPLPEVIVELAKFWQWQAPTGKDLRSDELALAQKNPCYLSQTIYECLGELFYYSILHAKTPEHQSLYGIITQRPAFIRYLQGKKRQQVKQLFFDYLDNGCFNKLQRAPELVQEIQVFLKLRGKTLSYAPELVCAQLLCANTDIWSTSLDCAILTSIKLGTLASLQKPKLVVKTDECKLAQSLYDPLRENPRPETPVSPSIPIPYSFKRDVDPFGENKNSFNSDSDDERPQSTPPRL